MSAAKKQESSPPMTRWLRALPAGSILLILLLAGLAGGGALAWLWYKPTILASPEYQIKPEQIEITPLPGWIHSDVRGESFRDATLDGPLSLLDVKTSERMFRAFSRHPWVAKVQRVGKQHPAGAGSASMQVELVYRKPVCMVEVVGGLLPVDAEGILLPSGDFSPSEAARYPRLQGVEQNPTGTAGSRWTNAKVIGGAEIAALLIPHWDAMKLLRIVPLAADPTVHGQVGGSRRSTEPFFALFTRAGSRILWGYAPGANALGELPAQEKVARLQRYLEQHDSLDGNGGRPQELDIRTLAPSVGP